MTTQEFLAEWHRVVDARDVAALGGFLSEEIHLGSPPYWQKLEGKDLVAHLLGLVVSTVEDFTYHREWCDGRELALEFSGHVGDVHLQGIDLITLDDEGRIVSLDVLMRPEGAIVALREAIAPRMQEFLG